MPGGKSLGKIAPPVAAAPRPLPAKTEGEEYAQCLRMLGANRLEARCRCIGPIF